jgi:N-terminal domain of galactosyltransferase
MYAMTTENALKLMMDESFEGWGGEDVEFYKR